MRRWRLAALACLLAAVPLAAEPPQAQPEPVKLSVVAICAHNRDENVDPRLKCMAEEIRKAVPQLTGFKVGKMYCKPVPVGTRETFKLVDDQEVVLTVVPGANKGDLQIKVTPPQMGEVTYETSCGNFFTIITKYRTKKNEVLILAVRVQPCKK
jgi:hypothetical protein